MSPAAWRPRTRDLVLAALFTLGWLLPVAIVGWRGEPPASWPTKARDFYSVSCLFGTAADHISLFYVQVQRRDRPGWQDFDEGEYFRLEPFGHRTRFDRFMARFGLGEAGLPARVELAQWLAARDQELHPERAPIVALRYVWVDRDVGAAAPQGCWRKPPRGELGAAVTRQLGRAIPISPGSANAAGKRGEGAEP